MYDLMRREARRQLQSFRFRHEYQYEVLKEAWRSTRTWTATKKRPKRLLVPYIGSGLNDLATGGLRNWGELVALIAKTAESLGSEHQVKRSGVTLPQQLELHLRAALEHPDRERRRSIRNSIVDAFRKVFGKEGEPSRFHKRLVEMFPVLVTTNYNQILEAAAGGWKSYDLTDPATYKKKLFPLKPKTILHLHGCWNPKEKQSHMDQIFWGVGDFTDKNHTRCLVLTEYQYHRLYNNRKGFQTVASQLFGTEHLMLFIGASLSSDESGVHAILTERRI